jgi:oligopeptidase B
MNTFTDFIDSAEYLVKEKWTNPKRLAINGASAGGLLMGAVTNMRPDLFKAVVAEVPFVDLMNTMLDPDLPLTVIEYEQWGNPHEKDAFDYMLRYSPYDNVHKAAYPRILVKTGFYDTNVSYWEGTKWAAKLRESTTSGEPILLKTNMDSGHGGASDRYKALEERALTFAFVLDALGVK